MKKNIFFVSVVLIVSVLMFLADERLLMIVLLELCLFLGILKYIIYKKYEKDDKEK